MHIIGQNASLANANGVSFSGTISIAPIAPIILPYWEIPAATYETNAEVTPDHMHRKP
jgi:hypothetical protein